MKRVHYDPATRVVVAYTNDIATEDNPAGFEPPNFPGDYVDVADDVTVKLGDRISADGKSFTAGADVAALLK